MSCAIYPLPHPSPTAFMPDINTPNVCLHLAESYNFTVFNKMCQILCLTMKRFLPRCNFKQWSLNYLRVLNECLKCIYSEDKQFPINLICSTISHLWKTLWLKSILKYIFLLENAKNNAIWSNQKSDGKLTEVHSSSITRTAFSFHCKSNLVLLELYSWKYL